MGCASSSPAGAKWDVITEETKERTKQIDASLAVDRAELRSRSEMKILILGTGESGKSTICKQMVVLHSGGFTAQDRQSYRQVVYSNTVQSMQAILSALPGLDLHVNPANEVAAALVSSLNATDVKTDPRIRDALKALWHDYAIRRGVGFKNTFQLNDSAEYFFDSLQRTMAADYVPTDDDIIRGRVRTTGVHETMFKINSDIRVNVLLFVVAISEYDQNLAEDEEQNRVSEALAVFDSVSNSQWFARSTLVLFLNKIDLFRAKLPQSSFKAAFPEYQGRDLDYTAASQFMRKQFIKRRRNPAPIYVVIRDFSEHIVRAGLADSGIL
ncbi:hypothetical protein RQP46_002484 [Phenoliferia psychrophenolica]